MHGPSAVEACDPRGEHELDPLPAVKVSEPLAELRSEDRLQGRRRRLDDRHGRAEPLCRCRDLLTDEAGSDHDQPWSCAERLAQCAGVVARAQFIYVFVALGARQATWRAAGGDQQLLERDPASARQPDLAPRSVESGCALAEHQFHVMLGIPRLRPEFERTLVELAGEKLLGQRWTVVRCMGLPCDHADRSVIAVAAQRLARALRGETAAGDHDSGPAPAIGRRKAHGHSIRRHGETPVRRLPEAVLPKHGRHSPGGGRATALGDAYPSQDTRAAPSPGQLSNSPDLTRRDGAQ